MKSGAAPGALNALFSLVQQSGKPLRQVSGDSSVKRRYPCLGNPREDSAHNVWQGQAVKEHLKPELGDVSNASCHTWESGKVALLMKCIFARKGAPWPVGSASRSLFRKQ